MLCCLLSFVRRCHGVRLVRHELKSVMLAPVCGYRASAASNGFNHSHEPQQILYMYLHQWQSPNPFWARTYGTDIQLVFGYITDPRFFQDRMRPIDGVSAHVQGGITVALIKAGRPQRILQHSMTDKRFYGPYTMLGLYFDMVYGPDFCVLLVFKDGHDIQYQKKLCCP